MFRLTASFLSVFGVLLVFTSGAFANTIYSVTGPGYTTGGSASIGGGDNDVLETSWTTLGAYSDVSVAAEVGCYQCAGLTITAYLTTVIGPSATVADQIASYTYITGEGPEIDTLFASLTLGSGTYYLTLSAPSGGLGYWLGAGSPTVTTDTGVTANGNGAGGGEGTLIYPPSSGFFLSLPLTSPQAFLVQVTGDAVSAATPEPGSIGLLTGGLAGLWLLKRRRSA
jgi:hypothetical protein